MFNLVTFVLCCYWQWQIGLQMQLQCFALLALRSRFGKRAAFLAPHLGVLLLPLEQ
ncbi:hypothetical protein ACPD0J_001425 [Vibrio cholerae]